ncbi:RNA polymerase sigma factor SigY [Bacillus alkalicellulosilyticus]|uniref:RNA polymerase sigma factor SigY n=1 Tax=Alkalihalobacterium alkalicellulosilyticum TaxID=1912214 RepID=UPI0009969DD4|nr:RNA polymerase sigma factor SigY [Bacillus alkalicellulosilyticus]
MEHEDDVMLIRKAIAGDDDAFSQLFQRYYSFLYKYLLKLTLDEEISSDLSQETMFKCYSNLSSYKGESKFSTWMISIASRLYIDYLRKQKREKKWLENLKQTLSRSLSYEAALQSIEWSDIFADFNQLQGDVRIPILLHHYYGYTYDEIGKMIGVRPGTVKSRIHNGLKSIRKEWDEVEKAK